MTYRAIVDPTRWVQSTSTETDVTYASSRVLSDGATGTGTIVHADSPTFTTQIITPLVIGGTTATSTLRLRSTSGVGAAGADIVFQVGNNGATEAMRILNSGRVGVGISPLTRLHVGAGSSGTNQEELRIDSGSGTNGDSFTSFYRGGTLKGLLGVSGGVTRLVNGDAADDLVLRSIQAFLLTVDNGGTVALKITSLGSTFAAAVNAASFAASGAVSGATMAATGAITGASVAATAGVSGATVSASGALTGASVAATGTVSGASVAATGGVTGATVAATGDVSGASVTIASGSAIKGHLANTVAWTPGLVASGLSVAATVTVTGAALGDAVTCSFSTDLLGTTMHASVSSANTVTLVITNNTGGNVTLGAGTARAEVWKH